MECKWISAAFVLSTNLDINRDILECKYLNSTSEVKDEEILIETYWNVNTRIARQINEMGIILIETYWNVNLSSWTKDEVKTFILIETYWNVNTYVRGVDYLGYRY